MNTFTQMLYNNLLSLVPMILVVSVAEVGDELARFPHWSNPIFLVLLQLVLLARHALQRIRSVAVSSRRCQFCLLMSATQAFLLNWFIFLCSRINSPLTTSVTGALLTHFSLCASCCTHTLPLRIAVWATYADLSDSLGLCKWYALFVDKVLQARSKG